MHTSLIEAPEMENIEIEVPFEFQCPISLELMRDPVTVSTGISYDRDSIERWLSSSKKSVCPVTKQPISSASDLIPNLTLRRLIQSWCSLHDRIPIPMPPVDHVSITKLISESGEDGGLETLAQIDASEEDLRSAMEGARSDELIQRLTRFMSVGDSQTRVRSIKLLKSLYSAADPNKLVMIKSHLFEETVKLIKDNVSTQATKLALKLLIQVNPWGRNRIKSVEAGAVHVLIEIILDGPEKRICELAMVVLDQLCATAEARAGLLGHKAGLAVVSKKILRVSNTVSDRAVRILGSICRHSGNGIVLGEMAEVGVVAKLCLVLQVDYCSLKTKERAKEILKANSRVWRTTSCLPSHLRKSYPTR